jgi:YesN/AraC family two-component response regulator
MKEAIICVDDERSLLFSLQHQISAELSDILIECAESGEEAIELLKELQSMEIDVRFIITDQMMPGIKGNEIIEIIQKLNPEITCILLTGYTQLETIKELEQSQKVKIISKPWEKGELLSILLDRTA